MIYYSCPSINNNSFEINGRIDTGKEVLSLCCEYKNDIPSVSFRATPQETMDAFIEMRNNVINESKEHSVAKDRGNRIYSIGCTNCSHYSCGEWKESISIKSVNLSMYPAPCQCKCTYCTFRLEESVHFNKQAYGEYYERLFDTLDYAQEKEIIDRNAFWHIASGEFTIHPYKDRILDLIKGKTSTICTNCFVFDDDIAQNLSENSNSAINFSIDAGTPQTWLKVKGVNNFDVVTENLVRYFSASSGSSQIILKYIVLPGINDTLLDYRSVIEIMKILHITDLTISRDVTKKYSNNTEQEEKLILSTSYLAALLIKNNMSASLMTFTVQQHEKISMMTKSLIMKGVV